MLQGIIIIRHYYQYTRPNRTNLFHKERLFNMKSCCGLKIHFAVWPAKRSLLERTVCHLAACSDNNANLLAFEFTFLVGRPFGKSD